MLEDVDLIVIGSGQGGSPLAVETAAAGKRVVLFERGRAGGSCVNYGCTPSKAYLASAHNAGRARRAASLGIHADVRVDVVAVMDRVRRVRDEWHDGSEEKLAASSLELVRASAAFTGERTVAGGGREFRAPHVVIDTGTTPLVPPIDGLVGTPFDTNLTWFERPQLPERLLVLGAGYIGLELGQGARRLGSAVTIVDRNDRPMKAEEADAVAVVQRSMERDGVMFVLGANVTAVHHDGTTFALTLGDGRTLEGDGLLVASGRAGTGKDLTAEQSGVVVDAHGYVETNDFLETACSGVYAIGDVAKQPAFTHVSWEDYRRLASTFAGTPRKRDDRVLSYSTFTEPQLARTGLDEPAAKAAGRDVRVRTIELANVARGEEWDLTDGFYRLVADATSGVLLGATCVGYEAGEIVHALAFAIQRGATWRDLDAFMGIHPTFGEGLPSLARMFEAS